MPEKYLFSIKNIRSTKVKIKKSVFICTMAYVQTIEDAKNFISKISKENQTASHNCWAYITGEKGNTFHSSDAGEPSSTAGKPMLNTLQSHDMTNIAVVVTRHFGGVKLGVRGLIEAYSLSVKNTIELKQLRKLTQSVNICVEVSYEFNDTLLNKIKNLIVEIRNTDYSEKIVHTFVIELKNLKKIDKILSEYHSRGMLEFTIQK